MTSSITINPFPYIELGSDTTVCGSTILDAGIGFNNYQYFSRLKTAEIDAKVVDATLREKYGFETQTTILDAVKKQIDWNKKSFL